MASNLANGCVAKPVLASHKIAPHPPSYEAPDFTDVTLCEFGRRTLTASKGAMSALRDLVTNIVGVSSQGKMVRANAIANVAMMQYLQPFRDWTISQFPSDAMRGLELILIPEAPIALIHDVTRPQPTGSGLFDAAPEALGRPGSETCHPFGDMFGGLRSTMTGHVEIIHRGAGS